MSKIDFKLLVEELLNESIVNLFVPANQAEHFEKIVEFTKNLHKVSGYGALKKDVLVSNKPYWPYADTLEYVIMQIARAIPEFRGKSFDEQTGITVRAIQNLDAQNIDTRKIGDALLKQVAAELNITFTPDQTTTNVDIFSNINNKINTLQDNRLNYRSYSNLRLAQANDETSVLAAEPYLNLTPQQAIIKVLQDFGGYDQNIAEKIVKYPAEPKYTQRAENIDNMVMKSIIEISKLTLIFYREYIQTHGPQILDLLNYGEYQNAISRNFMVNQDQINAALQQGAGSQGLDQSKITQLLSKITAVIGIERPITGTQALEKIFHDDYLFFIQGKSSLVLDSKAYENPDYLTQTNLNQHTLIKKIHDFDGQPGKGHSIYEAYLFLFNNIKKGELPSKWQAALKGIGQRAQAAAGAAKSIWNFSGQSLYPS
jgi:hypothetical protein